MFRTFVLSIFAVLSLTASGTAAADGAGVMAGEFQGSGFARPGLPSFQPASFGGSLLATVTHTPHGAFAFAGSCSFALSDSGTLIFGSGSANGGCSGWSLASGTVSLSCTNGLVTYERAGTVIVMRGVCTLSMNNQVHGAVVTITVNFTPTSTSSTQTDFAFTAALSAAIL